MLAETRYKEILAILDVKKAVTVAELVETLKRSEATVRRDLNALAHMGKLKKVHGGAMAIDQENSYAAEDDDIRERYGLHREEKLRIASYAASLIKEGDFIYIDAGSTTEAMVEFISATKAVYVTNSANLALSLARKDVRVYVIAGRMKAITGAIIGSETEESLIRYRFTKGFFGTNGIDEDAGFTTPDIEEAGTKSRAMARCEERFVLADPSKFGRVAPVSFGALAQAEIITTEGIEPRFKSIAKIREVSGK